MDYLQDLLDKGAPLDWITSRQGSGRTMEQIHAEWTASEGNPPRLTGIKPSDYSDAGNADVFCRTYGDQLIYTDSRGWLAWNGHKWDANDHSAHKLAVKLSADMLDDARAEYLAATQSMAEIDVSAAEGDLDKEAQARAKAVVKRARGYLNHASQLRNERRIKAMLELAKHELAVDPAILDADPEILNTPAGLTHLPTGKLTPHDPKRYCTKITACSPGTQGVEMWMDFLNTVSQNDGSMIGGLQMIFGMSAYGKVFEEVLIMFFGGGRNGKSTLSNAVCAALGDYSDGMDADILVASNQGNRGADIVELRGKRLVVCGELEEGRRLSAATMKKITSTDPITAAAKFRQKETFTPSHTTILHSNYLPRVGSTDDGTWRRLVPVEFKAKIPDRAGIANYGEVLTRAAGPAILAWVIQGAVNFASNDYKLTLPDVIAMAAEEYRQREDWLENFLSERCVMEPEAKAPAGELYKLYRQWAEESGDYIRRSTDFNAAMEGRGFPRRNTHGCKFWVGVKIDRQARFSA